MQDAALHAVCALRMSHVAAAIQVSVLTRTGARTENAHLKKASTIVSAVLKQSAERECFPESNRMAFLCLHADTEMKSFLTVLNVMRNMVWCITGKVSQGTMMISLTRKNWFHSYCMEENDSMTVFLGRFYH